MDQNINKKSRVTSYDVAREAGVSQSVVSRVFRPGASVSPKTKTKVLATAERMGYKPNAIARMLITRSSGMVAVIVSTRANLNYPEVLSMLTRRLGEHNKRVLLFTLDDESELPLLMEQLWTYQVDGVIALTAHFDHDSVRQFQQHHIPVVLYNRQVDDHSASAVCCNHELGLKQLVELLFSYGHREFLIVAGPKDSDVANERRKHAVAALAKLGINEPPIVFGDYSYDSGRKCLAAFVQQAALPTAVICGNDSMAIGVIDEIRENLRLNVPNDVSVVGFDGSSSSHWYSYRLTTISQPANQMTKAAVDILLDQINDPLLPAETRFWSGQLQLGATVSHAKSQ